MSNESKFNFSDDEQQSAKDDAVKENKEAIKQDAKGLFNNIGSFLSNLLDFRDDTDRDATITAIKADIAFKGATAWILICSIMVASVGLNANSTAVVIGAMLISPLMGPILGVGMSIAINDIDTLRKSLINLATMIVLSLLTAFLFFYIFPLREETSELLGRKSPDIRDVLIAFFGGLALIIARTKKGTIASVIFGVAIATALMPPLCTAGYGLAGWLRGEPYEKGLEFFTGAMNLFTINTIFIALATFIVLKVLRFPMLKYANSKKRKRISQIASVLAILIMIPAVFTFISVLRQSNFESDFNNFKENELEGLPHSSYIKKFADKDYNPDGTSKIILNTFADDKIDAVTIAMLENRLSKYRALNGTTKLVVNQANRDGVNDIQYMKELRMRDSLDLMSQQQKITYLEDRVKKLSRLERDQIPFEDLIKELKIGFERLESISFANEIRSANLSAIDTIKVFNVKWVDSMSNDSTKLKDSQKIERLLKERLDLDALIVRGVN